MTTGNQNQPSSPAAPSAPAAAARMESIVVMGNDAVLAARPASAVQVAHAGLRAGFDAIVPASWGEELVADECARQLCSRPTAAAIFCACPSVAQRTLRAGAELAPFITSLVPPPVALAQYLRALYAPRGVRLTYVGACPGAQSDVYDARIAPGEFLRLLADRGIEPGSEPDAFEAVIPPDRRRHVSQPGGLPAPSALEAAGLPHAVIELGDGDFVTELAGLLLDPTPKLIDAALPLGCACAGARHDAAGDARSEVIAAEPPRATAPVVTVPAWMNLALTVELPLASRAPSDIVAALARPRDGTAGAQPPQHGLPVHDMPGDRQVERHVESTAADVSIPLRRRSPPGGTPVVRPPATGPISRSTDGRVLPRAYVARRRGSSPRHPADGAPPTDD